MDRVSGVIDRDVPPKRIFGTTRELGGQMPFYLLRTPKVGFVLYFFSADRASRAE